MAEQQGYCGYNCEHCAARSEDPEIRRKMVAGWKKYFGHDYTAENVFCAGCREQGPHADSSCKARPCAIERGVESCTDCDEFPCAKLKPLLASALGMLIYTYPGTADITRDEYLLCMRQFDSMPGLIKSMIEKGRMPDWISELL